MARKAPPAAAPGRKAGAKPAAAARRMPRRGVLFIVRWTLIVAIWGALGLGGLVAWYAYDLPDIETLAAPGRRPSVTLQAGDGTVLASHGDLYGGTVRFDALPRHLVDAVLATEDRRFFVHKGFDPWAILRAAWVNLRAGAVRQGGSTLTQQLAKNLFLTPQRTLRRKVQELLLALWLEARFTKQQIFTIYINRVYLGAGTYGVAAASRRYFAKPAGRLTLSEAAMLAGLLKAPSRYSPLRDRKAARARLQTVLANMVEAGFLSPAQAAQAGRQRLRLTAARGKAARYFSDWALERVSGYVGHTSRDLVIATTLDTRLQRLAERSVARLLKEQSGRARVTQAALVALAPDGAIRALVGGRSYAASQFNRATQALRQPGSAFKLFVYLAAFEAGRSPDERVIDAPLVIDGWRPRNYDGRFRGPVTLREAFARSINTVAVRLSEQTGRDSVIAAARRLGVTSALKSHPSLALGASEVTLLELTAAYAALANGGRAAWPYGINSIRTATGEVMFRRAGSGAPRIIAARELARLRDVLRAVVVSGTGKAAALPWPAAGKTGTSQESRDAWFIGYSRGLVVGVWLGNDDGTPMRRVTGGGLPARLWRIFMLEAGKQRPRPPIPAPGRRDLPAGAFE
jgi:penicillin-binding protein 1A